MKNYGKGKRIVTLKKKTIQNKIYRQKNSQKDVYSHDSYTSEEDKLIIYQKNPETGEHVTQGWIANKIGRSLQAIESRRAVLKKKFSWRFI